MKNRLNKKSLKNICKSMSTDTLKINAAVIESEIQKPAYSKYRAKITLYNGVWYDSKFEAKTAEILDWRLKAGEIKHWDRQFKIVCIPYDAFGHAHPELAITHKVDFRIHHHDGTFELLEAKGKELSDYRFRRKWLIHYWLPNHPDHRYTVRKNKMEKN